MIRAAGILGCLVSLAVVRGTAVAQESQTRPAAEPSALVVFQTTDDRVWRAELVGERLTAIQRIRHVSRAVSNVAISPDGKLLAYTRHHTPPGQTVGGRRSIEVVDLASGALTRLSGLQGTSYGPQWSPDGRQLAVNVFEGPRPRWDVALVNLADQRIRRLRLPENGTDCMSAVWAPSGGWLCCLGMRRLYKVPLDAPSIFVDLTKVLPDALGYVPRGCSVSPDGTEVLFDVQLPDRQVKWHDGGRGAVFGLAGFQGQPRRVSPASYHAQSARHVDGHTYLFLGFDVTPFIGRDPGDETHLYLGGGGLDRPRLLHSDVTEFSVARPARKRGI